MADPLVSVIVPNFNYSKYLDECLGAIFNQNYDPMQVIFVDDGSTDQSIEVIQKFSHKMQIFRKKNSGVNSARNLGIKNATGKYIAFCDSDDVWVWDKIRKQVDFLEINSQYGVVYSGIQLVNEDLSFIRNQNPKYEGDCSTRFLEHPSEAIVLLGSSTALIRNSALAKVSGFDESMTDPGEDWDFFRRISQQTLIGFIPEPLVLYRQHSESGSRVSRSRYFQGNTVALRKLLRDNKQSISFLAKRKSWLKLHWSFFKTCLMEDEISLAFTQILKSLGPIRY